MRTAIKSMNLKESIKLSLVGVCAFFMVLAYGCNAGSADKSLDGVPRISVETAREAAVSGDALLVCAYEREKDCSDILLEGAINYKQLTSTYKDVPEDKKSYSIALELTKLLLPVRQRNT